MTEHQNDPRSVLVDHSEHNSIPNGSNQDNSLDACRFAIEAARLLADSHCSDVFIYDLRGISQVTNYIIIASGTSDRQIKGLARHLKELADRFNMDHFGSEKDELTKWLVLDFIEVMAHLFEPVTRAHYDLEMLWGDAPMVSWHRGQ